jgi:SAM-dependent methyltransferase
MKHNKVCNLEDWDELGIKRLPRRRKDWEVAMALEALGAVEGQDILGVGAGADRAVFELCNRGARVWATDLYASPGEWGLFAPREMLTNPAACAPMAFDDRRLVVQHMDARRLRFPDASFDGLFSLGSIEHFGALADIAQASREIGRVLKPGGIAAIATEYRLSGDGDGWPGVVLFSPATLDEAIVQPSGLRRLDKPDWSISEATLATAYPLAEFVQSYEAGREMRRDDVVLEHVGYTFTSVMVVLKKASGEAAHA